MNKDLDSVKNVILRCRFAILLVLAVLFMMWFVDDKCNNWYCELFGADKKLELVKIHGWILAGCLSAWAVMAANRRSDAMASGNRQERFRDAVDHLGHKSSSSVRQGGFHSLFHLALDDEERRPSIASILCAHIRETTNNKGYQKKHKNAPSTEIQSLLDLLFAAEAHPIWKRTKFWDLTPTRTNAIISQRNKQWFWNGLTPDLTKGYLLGAKISNAQLQGVDLEGVQLQGAQLINAQLQGADLDGAKLQGVQLIGGVELQGAQLRSAGLQGAHLPCAELQGANLEDAQLQGADLEGAELQGANLKYAQLQGADLEGAELQGANLKYAQLQGANLKGVQLQGANLEGVQLQGALSDQSFDLTAPFRSLIQDRVGKDSELSTVVFAGGVDKQSIDEWVSILETIEFFPKEELQSFKEEMSKHVGRDKSNQLPGVVITGKYEEEAKEWVKEYEEAMAIVPNPPIDSMIAQIKRYEKAEKFYKTILGNDL